MFESNIATSSYIAHQRKSNNQITHLTTFPHLNRNSVFFSATI